MIRDTGKQMYVTKLRERIAFLEERLRPFAKASEEMAHGPGTDHLKYCADWKYAPTRKDFRLAHAALHPENESE